MSLTPYDIIDTKKRGDEHTVDHMDRLVDGIMDGSIPDYQLAAWLMAVWFRGMTAEETFVLTDRMRRSGQQVDVSQLPGPTADKHSTGGVGDKISLILAPLAAELDLFVPMLSGRGLGHTGGTLDKLAAIPGYRTDLSPNEMIAAVGKVGCAITGQTHDIAPADRKLYHLRDVTATVDCVPLIVSSIMSKKLAAGPEHLVIDLKCGSGAFMRNQDAARELARGLIDTGTRAGRKVSAVVSDMDQPLGRWVGHAHEVEESIDVLRGQGPSDTRELTLVLVSEMVHLVTGETHAAARGRVEAALDSGRAYERFLAMVREQGGRLDPNDPVASLERAGEVGVLKAANSGWITAMQTAEIGRSLVDLGGGRVQQDDVLDLGVGLAIDVAIGQPVQEGDVLVRIHGRDERTAELARQRLQRAISIGESACAARDLVIERIA